MRQPLPVTNLKPLIELCHHRWTLPILAAMHGGEVCRYGQLAARLAMSRETLSQTLQGAVDGGWLERNPGHGHPLRPEYLLTPSGSRVAERACDLVRHIDAEGLGDCAYRKWTMASLAAMGAGGRHFSEIHAQLSEAGGRALTQALKLTLEAGLATRSVEASFPPRATYGLTTRGSALASLARRVLEAASE